MKALRISLLALASVCALACSRFGDSESAAEAEAQELPAALPIDMAPIQTGAAPAGGTPGGPYGGAGSDPPGGLADASQGLDLDRVRELLPLDELEPKRKGLISFSRLSLAGTDVESLLDHIFPLTGEDPPPYFYPEEVQSLDGT